MRQNFIKTLALGLALALSSAAPHAGTIVGGSSLLTSGYELQLETWLGQGSLTLTNIYSKGAGDTSYSFHSAVDGKGPTFVVMRATEDGNSAIIGGYNPQSWNSTGTYNTTIPDSARTAFVFNLTSGNEYQQDLSTGSCPSCGSYQAYNSASYGPTFGGGHDIYVDYALSNGYSYMWSYSSTGAPITTSLINGSAWDGMDVAYGAIEVFTILAGNTNVPEPASLALLGLGLAGLGFARHRRQKAA